MHTSAATGASPRAVGELCPEIHYSFRCIPPYMPVWFIPITCLQEHERMSSEFPEREGTYISAKNAYLTSSFSDPCPLSYDMVHEEQKDQPTSKLSANKLRTSYLPIFFVEILEGSHRPGTGALRMLSQAGTEGISFLTLCLCSWRFLSRLFSGFSWLIQEAHTLQIGKYSLLKSQVIVQVRHATNELCTQRYHQLL